jgi:cytochrome c peroxidase
MNETQTAARSGTASRTARAGLAAVVVAGLLWGLSACTSPTGGGASGPRASQLPPMSYPADNPLTPAKLALGKQLFADQRLSGTGKMACQSCHYRNLGWTDAQVLSQG